MHQWLLFTPFNRETSVFNTRSHWSDSDRSTHTSGISVRHGFKSGRASSTPGLRPSSVLMAQWMETNNILQRFDT